jgi:hypothetical protein
MVSLVEPAQCKRMIVLVPDGITDLVGLAHKIRWMAVSNQCEVLYLALVNAGENTLSVSRRMATLKAVTSDNTLSARAKLAPTHEWLKILNETFQSGDMLVCHEEQSVKAGFFKTRPIKDFLEETLNRPVKSISGFYHPWEVQKKGWLTGFLFWAACLAILAVFTFFEIHMEQTTHGLARLMILTFLAISEVGIFWALSGISG